MCGTRHESGRSRLGRRERAREIGDGQTSAAPCRCTSIDGASAIHSAEVVSALANRTRLLIEVPRVWSASVSVT
jgi:hypothetical protein